MGRHHHDRKIQDEENVFAGEFKKGEGVSGECASGHLNNHNAHADDNTVDKKSPEGRFAPGFYKILPTPNSGQPLRGVNKNFFRGFEGGEDHPDVRQENDKRCRTQDGIHQDRF